MIRLAFGEILKDKISSMKLQQRLLMNDVSVQQRGRVVTISECSTYWQWWQ